MKVNDEVFQWKMSFNPDASKQAEEIIISLKLSKASHPTLFSTIVMSLKAFLKNI